MGEAGLIAQHRALFDLASHRAHTIIIRSHDGDPDSTYAHLLEALQ